MVLSRIEIHSVITALIVIVVAAVPFSLSIFPSRSLQSVESPEFVTIDIGEAEDLRVQRRQVTVADWAYCVNDGACSEIRHLPEKAAPITGVNWFDVQSYLSWKSKRDGRRYRLPTHMEWVLTAAEFAPSPKDRYFTAPELAWAKYDITTKVEISNDTLTAINDHNSFGIVGLQDHIWEWTSSCRETQYLSNNDCWGVRIAMGLYLATIPELARDPSKVGCGGGSPPQFVGFRMVVSNT